MGNQQAFCSLLFASLIFLPFHPPALPFPSCSSLVEVLISTPSACRQGNTIPGCPADQPAVPALGHRQHFQLSPPQEPYPNTSPHNSLQRWRRKQTPSAPRDLSRQGMCTPRFMDTKFQAQFCVSATSSACQAQLCF